MTTAIWWLTLGLLAGWLIEWTIDWLYWRQRRQAPEMEAQAAQRVDADNQRLRAELNAATALAQQRQFKIDELEKRLAGMHAEGKTLQVGMEAPEARLPVVVPNALEGNGKPANLATIRPLREDAALPTSQSEQSAAGGPDTSAVQHLLEREVAQPATRRDPLIDINGIGPAYERKLFDAGVYTFEDLAALTPEQVRAIIAPQQWQEIDPASWVAEARQLAQKKA